MVVVVSGRSGPQCVRAGAASPGDGHPTLSTCQEDQEAGRHPHPGRGRGHVLQRVLQGQSSKDFFFCL